MSKYYICQELFLVVDEYTFSVQVQFFFLAGQEK